MTSECHSTLNSQKYYAYTKQCEGLNFGSLYDQTFSRHKIVEIE